MLGNNIIAGASLANTNTGYSINYAVALDGVNDYLHWTPSGAGDSSTTWTFSCWIKHDLAVSTNGAIISAGNTTDYTAVNVPVVAAGDAHLGVFKLTSSAAAFEKELSRHDADPASWYNYVVIMDTSNGTEALRLREYVNGVEYTDFQNGVIGGTNSYPTASEATDFGTTDTINIGRSIGSTTRKFVGAIAEVIMIDGIVEDVSSFGETDATTGQLVPVDPSGIASFGTNGFWLDFKVAPGTGNGAGTDVSGNGNHFTDVSLTAASQVVSTPTDNFATLDPLSKGSTITTSNGNLTVDGGATGGQCIHSTIAIPDGSGVWQWEMKIDAWDVNNGALGIRTTSKSGVAGDIRETGGWGIYAANNAGLNGYLILEGSAGSDLTDFAVNDYVNMVYDSDNHNLYIGKNVDNGGGWLGSADPAALTGANITGITADNYCVAVNANSSTTSTLNFGATTTSASLVTGAKWLSTNNLPEPAIPDPSKHFYSEVVTHDGTSTASTCSFNLDTYEWLCIIKNTTGAVEKWYWIDSIGGSNLYWSSNASDGSSGQTTDANVLTVSGTTFTLGSTLGAKDYLVEFHKAGLAADTASNTGGTINSTSTSVNLVSGFSIGEFEGTGANGTVGHGLSQAPEFVIHVPVDTTNANICWHTGLTSGAYYVQMSDTDAEASNAGIWNSTAPSSTVVSVGTNDNANATSTMRCYYWHSVEGYSFFGSYEGNGNANGPFINTGMYGGHITVRDIDGVSSWQTRWTVLNPVNPVTGGLLYNGTNISVGNNVDIVSNGLKIRTTGATENNNASTHLFSQIGGTPFKYSNGK